jgi:phage terminase small subunit
MDVYSATFATSELVTVSMELKKRTYSRRDAATLVRGVRLRVAPVLFWTSPTTTSLPQISGNARQESSVSGSATAWAASRTAAEQAYENLRKPEIADAIVKGRSQQLARTSVRADQVLEEVRRCAFVDIRGFLDTDGNPKPLANLTAEQGAAVARLEVVEKSGRASRRVSRIGLWDKLKALELLARHFKLLTDVVQTVDAEKMIERLKGGRDRMAELKRKRAYLVAPARESSPPRTEGQDVG